MPSYLIVRGMVLPESWCHGAHHDHCGERGHAAVGDAGHARSGVCSVHDEIFMGGTPLGAPIMGRVGQSFGARWTLIGGGLVVLARRSWLSRMYCSEQWHRAASEVLDPRPHVHVHIAGGVLSHLRDLAA